jgi:hypothetical protein
MPLMKSLRRFRLASLTGHVINFEPNKPINVPKAVLSEALAAGCALVDESGELLDDSAMERDDSSVHTGFAPALRESVLILTLDGIRKHNRAGEFDAGGVPLPDVVAKRSNIETNKKEVGQLWRKLLEQVNGTDDAELKLHPDAVKVVDIAQADNHADLDLLADELGLKDKVEGMKVRDKRQRLLAHFSGSGATE